MTPDAKSATIERMKVFAPGATDAELEMFAHVCRQTGLDPARRQIYYMNRGKGPTYMVSIDGLRITAVRTREYRGQTPIQWCGKDGVWCDAWLESHPPLAARAGVWRAGFSEPLYRVALWSEYAQQTGSGALSPMWKRMPAHMLGKCAEALALRAAFSEACGLYIPEEMDEEDTPAPTKRAAREEMDEEDTPAAEREAPAKKSYPDPGTGLKRARSRFFAVMADAGIMAGKPAETSKEEWRQMLSRLLCRPVALARDLTEADWMEAIQPVLRLRAQLEKAQMPSDEAACLAAINAACSTDLPAISEAARDQWEKAAVHLGADPFAEEEVAA